MKLIIVLIITLHLYWAYKYRKYINPYGLYMIFGKKGSGKSSYLCKIALKYKKRGYQVYTNMTEMMIPEVRVIEPDDLGKFIPPPKSCIILDEVGILYDNRNYKQFKPEVRDFFKLQRHYKCVVYLASQSFDVDKKIRDLTDKMYLLSGFYPWASLIRPVRKKIGIVEASGMGESRIVDNLKIDMIWTWRILWIPKYVKWFDSYQAPQKPEIEYTKIK